MSGEALGWVYRHSPYKGATFHAHVAIGDTVSDLNDNEFWMRTGALASKARLTRGSVSKALAELVAGGYLTILQPAVTAEGKATGRPARYRFEMPEAEVVFESRGARSRDTPTDGGARSARTRVSSQRAPGARTARTINPREPNDEPAADVPSARQALAERKIEAREIATSYYDWHRETTRVAPPEPFMAVAKVVEAALAAGFTRAQIKRALAESDQRGKPVTRQVLWELAGATPGRGTVTTTGLDPDALTRSGPRETTTTEEPS